MFSRFDGMAMVERLRDKRVVFVGDSISRNQWASMVCLLDSSIPPPLKSLMANGSIITLKINVSQPSMSDTKQIKIPQE